MRHLGSGESYAHNSDWALKSLNMFNHRLNRPTMKYRVSIETDEDGAFIAKVPALPGCISQGKTRKEALANIKDAIEGYIASLKKHNEPVPPPIEEEMVEVSA